MNNSVQVIPFANLALAFIPVLVVIVILYKWSLNSRNAFYAILRMLAQLLLIGYFLAYIFEVDSAWIVVSVLAVMVMCMIYSSAGISSACFLSWVKPHARDFVVT